MPKTEGHGTLLVFLLLSLTINRLTDFSKDLSSRPSPFLLSALATKAIAATTPCPLPSSPLTPDWWPSWHFYLMPHRHFKFNMIKAELPISSLGCSCHFSECHPHPPEPELWVSAHIVLSSNYYQVLSILLFNLSWRYIVDFTNIFSVETLWKFPIAFRTTSKTSSHGLESPE